MLLFLRITVPDGTMAFEHFFKKAEWIVSESEFLLPPLEPNVSLLEIASHFCPSFVDKIVRSVSDIVLVSVFPYSADGFISSLLSQILPSPVFSLPLCSSMNIRLSFLLIKGQPVEQTSLFG
jgi:hypothetical protein